MLNCYYNFPCPLCQHDVDISQPDYFRILPVDSEKMAVFHQRPICNEYDTIRVGDLLITWKQGYPQLEYMQRVWCLHTRCIGFVDHLPMPKLYLLLDIVESNFLSRRNPPVCRYGSFYAQPIQEEDPMPTPTPTAAPAGQLTKSLWNAARAFVGCALPEKEQQGISLPAEIWNLIFQYDIGRLLFVARAAAKLTDIEIQRRIPNTRFRVDIVDIPSSMVQIHLISIGGRLYISNLSDSVVACATQDPDIKYDLRGKNYLAVKTDGIGVVDIAFEQEESCGQPKWILQNKCEPFAKEFSQIRNASLQNLRIVRDTLKCRAIVPVDQSSEGSEPYFSKPPFPPDSCYVSPGLYVDPRLIRREDSHIYFTQATYTPFSNMTRISFDFEPQVGIIGIHANDPTKKEQHSVTFNEPPTTLKFVVCHAPFMKKHYQTIQFKVNDQWVPEFPVNRIVVKEVLVENVVGLWLGKTYPFTSTHIGTVVSQ